MCVVMNCQVCYLLFKCKLIITCILSFLFDISSSCMPLAWAVLFCCCIPWVFHEYTRYKIFMSVKPRLHDETLFHETRKFYQVCNYVAFVWRGFLFLWVLGMGYVILLWHSLSLPYNYFEHVAGLKTLFHGTFWSFMKLIFG